MEPLENIRAVTFDVGGTLIEPWPSVGHVYAEVGAEFGIASVNPERLNRSFAAAWKARDVHDFSRAAWQRIVHDTFTLAGTRPPSNDCFNAIYHRFARASAWRVFEDTRPALEALARRDLALGVISNWDERLRPLLATLDLTRYFRAVIISSEVGHTKPAGGIFLRAASDLGCDPGSILHIGDREQEDVAGATAAGFRALRLERHPRATVAGSGNAGNEVISSLDGLPAALEAAGVRSSTD